jgi:5-formyltetrahydrofolate cyclo-ligase
MANQQTQIRQEKERLRRRILRARRRLAIEEREQVSEVLAARLFELPEWVAAEGVGLYASLPGEVESSSLVWHEVSSLAELESGAYGVREPRADLPVVEVHELGLLLVPGVVFDEEGNRIGFGKGYYDRVLASYHGSSVTLIFACQLVEKVPVDAWDERVGKVISESLTTN